MNVADEQGLARIAFIIFIVSISALLIVVLTAKPTSLQQSALTNKIQQGENDFYTISGIIESHTTNNRTHYYRIQTFCTLNAQYDALFYPEPNITTGDFVQVSGKREAYGDKEYLQITKID